MNTRFRINLVITGFLLAICIIGTVTAASVAHDLARAACIRWFIFRPDVFFGRINDICRGQPVVGPFMEWRHPLGRAIRHCCCHELRRDPSYFST